MDISITFGNSSEKILRAAKGKSILALPSNYTVIDLETTGLDPEWNDIIEFGAVRVEEGTAIDSFSALVNPGYEIDEFITDLTGITNDMLSSAPSIECVLPDFLKFVGDSIVIGHNVNFDINFIYDNCVSLSCVPFQNDYIDTMRLSRRLFPQERHHRLCDLTARFCIGDGIKHRASADVEYTNQCYLYMKQHILNNNIDLRSLFSTNSTISAKNIQPSNTDFDVNSPIYEKVFVFTGTLDRMSRKEAMQLVVDRGGLCGDGVNKATNYLVLGNNDYCSTIKDGKSTKHRKAEQLKLSGSDIEIISENVFYDMLG